MVVFPGYVGVIVRESIAIPEGGLLPGCGLSGIKSIRRQIIPLLYGPTIGGQRNSTVGVGSLITARPEGKSQIYPTRGGQYQRFGCRPQRKMLDAIEMDRVGFRIDDRIVVRFPVFSVIHGRIEDQFRLILADEVLLFVLKSQPGPEGMITSRVYSDDFPDGRLPFYRDRSLIDFDLGSADRFGRLNGEAGFGHLQRGCSPVFQPEALLWGGRKNR